MMEVGRLCMKLAGRDANKMCFVIEILDGNYVVVDGETRRKKCNIKHLEPIDKVVKLKSGSRDEIKKVCNDLGLVFFDPKSKKSVVRTKKTKTKKEVLNVSKKKNKPDKADRVNKVNEVDKPLSKDKKSEVKVEEESPKKAN